MSDAERLTYGEASVRSEALASHLLASGAGVGTRVGIFLPNSVEFVISWLAVARIGAITVPISTLSTSSELRTIMQHAELDQLITTRRAAQRHRSGAGPGELGG